MKHITHYFARNTEEIILGTNRVVSSFICRGQGRRSAACGGYSGTLCCIVLGGSQSANTEGFGQEFRRENQQKNGEIVEKHNARFDKVVESCILGSDQEHRNSKGDNFLLIYPVGNIYEQKIPPFYLLFSFA